MMVVVAVFSLSFREKENVLIDMVAARNLYLIILTIGHESRFLGNTDDDDGNSNEIISLNMCNHRCLRPKIHQNVGSNAKSKATTLT